MELEEEFFLEDFPVKAIQDEDSVIITVTAMWQGCFPSISSSLPPQSLAPPETKIVEVVRLDQILNMFGNRVDGIC